MKNTMTYRGYVGSIEFSESDGVLFGKVLGIRSLLSYEGNTAKELVEDFHGVVDDYFNVCEAEGVEPEVAYKGSFNVRTTPDIHRRAANRSIVSSWKQWRKSSRRKVFDFMIERS